MKNLKIKSTIPVYLELCLEKQVEGPETNDYNLILPEIQGFYRSFFKHDVPSNLEKILSIVKKNQNGYKQKYGSYFLYRDKIEIVESPLLIASATLIHELAHRNYELETNIEISARRKELFAFIPVLGKDYNLKRNDTAFLHECIACSVETSFIISRTSNNSFKIDEMSMLAEEKQKIKELFYLYEEEHRNLPFWIPGLSHVFSQYGTIIGAYIGLKHKENSDLWNKLNKINSVDNLKELVDD